MLITRATTASAVWSFPLTRGITSLAEGAQITAPRDFIDARPRWMPGGEAVVFESNRRGALDIWLADVGSGDVTRLTSSASPDASPRPSPDGSWIAFERAGSGATTIRLVRPDGSGEATPDSTWSQRFREVCCVSWAGDSRAIALSVVQESGGRKIATAQLDPATGVASELRVLDVPGESQSRPRFSPDGRFIAYEARGDGDWDLWVIDADGSNPRSVASSSALERQAAWAPDQSGLFYVDDAQDIWRVPLDGDANPDGAAELWFDLPLGAGVGEDGLDVRPGRLLIAVGESAGDLWVVDFSSPAGTG
jgi:Tol biopolymer transport system component